MNYIIFDLEWNNAYNYKTQKGMNEIIEIGAVKLDSRLGIVDTFKQLIKPRLSKKLGGRFKNLTNISMEEINENGIDFDDAFSDFARWGRGENNIFLSWSKSDLYTLVDNFVKFKGTTHIDFIEKYADVQEYCMQFIENHNGNQISLSHCAELFEIDLSNQNLHRALEDCFVCPDCKGNIDVLKNYDYVNKAFRSAGKCVQCNKKFWIFVRAKQNYDNIAVTKKLIEINKRRARHIN